MCGLCANSLKKGYTQYIWVMLPRQAQAALIEAFALVARVAEDGSIEDHVLICGAEAAASAPARRPSSGGAWRFARGRVAVRDPFATLADQYDDWGKTALGRLTEDLERRHLLDLLDAPPRGLRVLDVGCGTGSWAGELGRLGARVWGVDRSPAMIEAARRKATQQAGTGGSVEFLVGDARRLPFGDAQFDLVTALLMLEWSEDAGLVMREAARVTRPGGRVLVAILNRRSLWTLQRRLTSLRRPSVYTAAQFLTREELLTHFEQAGLRPTRVRSAVYYPPWGWAWLLRAAPWWEAAGRRFYPTAGAFIAALARRPAGFQSTKPPHHA